VEATTLTSGKVTEVSFQDGIPYLRVNGEDVPFSDIISVREAAT
jgi:hypothetical protein